MVGLLAGPGRLPLCTLTGAPVVLATLATLAALAGSLLALLVAIRACGVVRRRVAARRGPPGRRHLKVPAGADRPTVIICQVIAVVVSGMFFAALALAVQAGAGWIS